MKDYKDIPRTSITYNHDDIKAPVGNLYKAISIIAKRSEQIGIEMKEQLDEKLELFETYNEDLEEEFENKEQIEISKFHEKMPKPHIIALDEWTNDKIYYRKPEE